MLGSGSAKLVSQSNILNEQSLNFNGTYIGLRLERSPTQFSGIVKDIIDVGENEALRSGVKTKASNMSKRT